MRGPRAAAAPQPPVSAAARRRRTRRGVRVALNVVATADHGALLYYAFDRYVWDIDAAHAADQQSFKYWTLIVSVAYAGSVVVMLVRWAASIYYCARCPCIRRRAALAAPAFVPRAGIAKPDAAACGWSRPAIGMEWVDELGEWNAALAIMIGLCSLVPFSYLLAWAFIGTYPRGNLGIIVALTLLSLVVNDVLFFVFTEDDRGGDGE